MEKFKRYGFYVVPEGDLFAAGSAWLGWNSATGQSVAHPRVPDLPDTAEHLTAKPRKYGFHGTIKPPFFLADGTDAVGLDASARTFCATQAPVVIPQMEVRRIGSFAAIVPSTPSAPLAALAAATVRALDTFRAPPSEAELARRRKARLSAAQEALLQRWGYPYVMAEFRFHLTLTGHLRDPAPVCTALATHFAPYLEGPVVINSLALMGEDAEGQFHLVHRYTLPG